MKTRRFASATLSDRPRLDLEDAIAALTEVQDTLQCVAMRLAHRLRDADDAQHLTDVNAARLAAGRAKAALARQHPNRRTQ